MVLNHTETNYKERKTMFLTAMTTNSKFNEIVNQISPKQLVGITRSKCPFGDEQRFIISAEVTPDRMLVIARDVQATLSPLEEDYLPTFDRLSVECHGKAPYYRFENYLGQICFWTKNSERL